MFTNERLESIERTAVGAAILAVLLCAVGGPQLRHGPTREQLVKAFVRSSRQATQLQASLKTAQSHVESQKAELTSVSSSSERLQEQVRSLQKERDTLKGQIADATGKINGIESQLQAARSDVAKLNDLVARDDTGKQRDEAQARATKAEDRVRELTLMLHKAGVWP